MKPSERHLYAQVWYIYWGDGKTWEMSQMDLLRHAHLSVAFPCGGPNMAASVQAEFLGSQSHMYQKRESLGCSFNTFYDLALEVMQRHFGTF